MECNKEEAIRAKEIAENRLLNRDYAGAKEMALKAEKLFPQLENISQLLTVCEVHFSAQVMANGLYNWYRIIQVEPLSDEIVIKKQYRKLALLLHPDKNKFPGAEGAFKLVSEANNTLSDRSKRLMYDLKAKHLVRSAGLQQSTKTNSAHNSSSNSNTTNNYRQQQPPEPQPHQGFTFWTECPGCRTRHQYYCNILSKTVCCRICYKTFRANSLLHLNPGNRYVCRSQPQQFVGQQQPQQSNSNRFTCNVESEGTTRDIRGGFSMPSRNCPRMSNYSGQNTIIGQRGKKDHADTSEKPNPCSKPNLPLDAKQRNGDAEGTDGGTHVAGTSTSLGTSHNKPDVKCNITGVSSSVKKARIEVKGAQGGNDSGTGTPLRRSSHKPDVKYNATGVSCTAKKARVEVKGEGDGNNDGTSTPLRRSLRNKPDAKYNGTGVSKLAKKARVEVKGDYDSNDNVNTTSASASANARSSVERELKKQDKEEEKEQLDRTGTFDSSCGDNRRVNNSDDQSSMMRSESSQANANAGKLYDYPCPEFHNFDICRAFNKFQQGNIWALYSELDTFPKYYALICKVEHEPFKIHISWLDACPKSKMERAWLDADFPMSCGKFKVTTQNNTIYDSPDYFSHMVSVKHRVRHYYVILPEVGEIWAVYKNWSAGWTVDDFKTCKFDIVEIIEQREGCIIVRPLKQVPEYRSVFMPEVAGRIGSGTREVPASEYILFSHNIPAIHLTEECGGKLKGFWELDTASVPCAFLHPDKGGGL